MALAQRRFFHRIEARLWAALLLRTVEMPLLNDLRMAAQYAKGLYDFWRAPYDTSDPVGAVRAQLAQRDRAFESAIRRAVFQHPASPYLPLLQAANIHEERFSGLVRDHGVEGTLQRLYEAGVYITLDEFKGRRPIRRGQREYSVSASDFDNPRSHAHMVSQSGGSRSQGTRLVIDLHDMLEELAARQLFMQAHGLMERPYAMWRPAPPAIAGLRHALRSAKVGVPLVRWYSQTHPGVSSTGGKSAYLTWCTALLSALIGHRVAWPRHLPVHRADVVARWLAEQTARGVSVHLDVIVSSGVRICQEARALGLDIHGHVFRTNSEPLTDAKADLMRKAGIHVCSMYGLTETGMVGVSCADPIAVDDMHLLTFRAAVLQQERMVAGWPEPVGALLLTVFTANMSKVMLNVEVGDYGVMLQRECGCPLGKAGLHWHLHTIRSYEKLTSAGMHFVGTELLDLLETALPQRFGGGPTDYQLVEDEVDGETVLRLVAAPSLGPLDETEVISFVLERLRRAPAGGRLMTEVWRDSHLLRLERAQPYVTGAAKVQPLHVLKKR